MSPNRQGHRTVNSQHESNGVPRTPRRAQPASTEAARSAGQPPPDAQPPVPRIRNPKPTVPRRMYIRNEPARDPCQQHTPASHEEMLGKGAPRRPTDRGGSPASPAPRVTSGAPGGQHRVRVGLRTHQDAPHLQKAAAPERQAPSNRTIATGRKRDLDPNKRRKNVVDNPAPIREYPAPLRARAHGRPSSSGCPESNWCQIEKSLTHGVGERRFIAPLRAAHGAGFGG